MVINTYAESNNKITHLEKTPEEVNKMLTNIQTSVAMSMKQNGSAVQGHNDIQFYEIKPFGGFAPVVYLIDNKSSD